PEGVVPTVLRHLKKLFRRRPHAASKPAISAPPVAGARKPAEAGGPLLVCDGVHKSFGGIHALRGVALDVRRGEILGLVGPNGSGKTTLINVISGQYRRDSGTIAL